MCDPKLRPGLVPVYYSRLGQGDFITDDKWLEVKPGSGPDPLIAGRRRREHHGVLLLQLRAASPRRFSSAGKNAVPAMSGSGPEPSGAENSTGSRPYRTPQRLIFSGVPRCDKLMDYGKQERGFGDEITGAARVREPSGGRDV